MPCTSIPRCLPALQARGITDPSLVLFDVWTYGKAMMPEQWRDRRLGWCDLWMRETPQGNPYAHPISGLKIIVDVNTLEVLEIEDHHDYGLPKVDGEYDPQVRGTHQRTDLKPLEISQPEGVSFAVDGNELRWQNWSMRLGFNYPRRSGDLPGRLRRSGHQARHRIPDVIRRRWWCRIEIRASTTTGGPHSTSANGASAT